MHRTNSLSEIYKTPATALHSAYSIIKWIKTNVSNPLLIGPDSESEQWVSQAAREINAPYIVLEKKRTGDKEVEVFMPNVSQYVKHTPVLVDDIISTARTMIQTVKVIQMHNMQAPVCIGIHAVFAENAYNELLQLGVANVVTCNTIAHISNGIDISGLIADVLQHNI